MKPSIGRIVHLVQNGVHYAAVIVKVWSDTNLNLKVFRNGSNDIVPGALDHDDIAHSVEQSELGAEWSWHWPEQV